jgi:hypothetical protein
MLKPACTSDTHSIYRPLSNLSHYTHGTVLQFANGSLKGPICTSGRRRSGRDRRWRPVVGSKISAGGAEIGRCRLNIPSRQRDGRVWFCPRTWKSAGVWRGFFMAPTKKIADHSRMRTLVWLFFFLLKLHGSFYAGCARKYEFS